MAKESMQKKLDRVRPPRVQIKYEVEIGDAMEMKELPFVLGVLGDYTGKPEKPLPPLKQRKFVNIDRDNFDKVLEGMAPRLAYRADDKLSGEEGKQLNVELKFKSMDDFHPENVARQIGPLKQLLQTRDKLKDLLGKLEGNDKLDELLQSVLNSTEAQQSLKKDLGVEDSAGKE
ncbi:MAG: type VI secretion system contractile sheath small subunit [Planctomycetota bacterium]|nr:type VI secretion system contractile sheath small subunit [Planctomycetaceae bacterium]MDQ3331209.1 type VI secretion system contractile sheath small subunit [Planctomycetota bacterium]